MLKWHQECDWVTPAPFSLAGTYLSGAPTTWMRHLYYRFSWRKAGANRLDLREQPFRLKSARPIDGSDGDGRK